MTVRQEPNPRNRNAKRMGKKTAGSYTKRLMARLNDSDDGWPHFETGDFMDVLDDVAEKVFAMESVEGRLAALLIWHQICEEMAKLLLQDAQFLIQLSAHPWEIEFRAKKKQMFGQVLSELSETVSFKGKEGFLSACRDLNTLRIELVHRLTRHPSLADVIARVRKTKIIYDEAFRIFEDAHDDFRVAFSYFAEKSLR
jgi:hypothetical protein